MTTAEDDKNCERLMRWAEARGITDAPRNSGSNFDGLGNSLVVSNFADAGGRGLAACRNLKEGELILRVPKSALMSVLSAKADPVLCNVLPRYPGLSSTQVLTLHLLNEAAKGQASSWFPYLVCLPRIYHTLSYFTKAGIRALQVYPRTYWFSEGLYLWTFFSAMAMVFLVLSDIFPSLYQGTKFCLQVDEARWVAEQAVEKARMDWEDAKSFMGDINLRRRFRSFRAWLWASGTVTQIPTSEMVLKEEIMEKRQNWSLNSMMISAARE
ncbi:hypothetical protein R1sor_023761 [Riccia sorocarpa]|uniref:Uncharacterized protein n=1 Tax=Riccia sorocarpa TaxID=122646 RepID=A0ABD3GNK6_9MARC